MKFIVYHPPTGEVERRGNSYIYAVPGWKNGEAIDLGKEGTLQLMHEPGGGGALPMFLEDLLNWKGHGAADQSGMAMAVGEEFSDEGAGKFCGGDDDGFNVFVFGCGIRMG